MITVLWKETPMYCFEVTKPCTETKLCEDYSDTDWKVFRKFSYSIYCDITIMDIIFFEVRT